MDLRTSEGLPVFHAIMPRMESCPKPPRYVPYKGTYVLYDGTYGALDQSQTLDV
jgi:hypothetical protein